MKLTINGKDYEVPFDPMLITLDDFILWWDQYGKELDEQLKEILEIEDEDEKFERWDDLIDQEAISWFSFWTKIDLFDAQDLPEFHILLANYRIFKKITIDSEEKAKREETWSFEWHGEQWEIQDYKVNPATKMSFSETIHGKEVVRQIIKLEESRWLALKYLSAVFLRHPEEKFDKTMVMENSPRLNLMGELPISHAFKVGFFLSICANISKKISQSSQLTETAKNKDLRPSLKNGVGITS